MKRVGDYSHPILLSVDVKSDYWFEVSSYVDIDLIFCKMAGLGLSNYFLYVSRSTSNGSVDHVD